MRNKGNFSRKRVVLLTNGVGTIGYPWDKKEIKL